MTVCVRTHPSNDNVFGRYAGRFLYSRGRGAHFASAFFYMFDVFHSIFLYSWQRYDITIFVRYLMGAAYLPSPLHVYAYRFFSAIVPRSRAMFFLDVPPEVAFERIRLNRDKREMFEDMSSLRKVRARALSLTTIGRWILIDARGPPTGIEFEIRRRLGSMRFLS
jgi:dTMP kinase